MATQIQTTAGEVRLACKRTTEAIAPHRAKYLADLERYDNAWFYQRWFMDHPYAWEYYNVDARVQAECLADVVRALPSDAIVMLDAEDAWCIGLGEEVSADDAS